jgi:formylglycine-generating enzyme required for sulfatase activity
MQLLCSENALMDSEPVIRARAGDTLARLGDPRFDPQCFYLPADQLFGFVRIPADPDFRIGTRKTDAPRVREIIGFEVTSNEINDAPTPTDEFFIAQYPVTVAQFRAFVDATGFEIGDADALRDPDSRPLRWVSCHEALAYCDWLNEILTTSEILENFRVSQLVRSGRWRVTLPSELEWEKAARGGWPDAIFSWGDEPDPNRANYVDSQIGGTSAVGCFSPNGYGLHDMIGNLWEWTRSLWGKDWRKTDFEYPYQPDDIKREDLRARDDVGRVVRGGSWYDSRVFARCCHRSGDQPDYRSDLIGFRVVLRSAPVS